MADSRVKVGISFAPDEKQWLDNEAAMVGIPLATLLKSLIVQHYHLPQRVREARDRPPIMLSPMFQHLRKE